LAIERPNRRLTTILAADAVGYSRLVGIDEEGTLDRLRIIRKDLIDPMIVAHRGRIVKTIGDGLLAEFASVVDAVRSAIDMQQAMAESNSGLVQDRRIEFALASISVTWSWRTMATSWATASMWRRDWRALPTLVVFAFLVQCMTRCGANWISPRKIAGGSS
jgi:hypothetical protein